MVVADLAALDAQNVPDRRAVRAAGVTAHGDRPFRFVDGIFRVRELGPRQRADIGGRLRQQGGSTIAEAEDTAVVWGMPGELVRAGGADFVEPLGRIADRLLSLVAAE